MPCSRLPRGHCRLSSDQLECLSNSFMAPTWSHASCQSSWVAGSKKTIEAVKAERLPPRTSSAEFVPLASLLLVGEVGQKKSFFNISIKTLLMESTGRSANSQYPA